MKNIQPNRNLVLRNEVQYFNKIVINLKCNAFSHEFEINKQFMSDWWKVFEKNFLYLCIPN